MIVAIITSLRHLLGWTVSAFSPRQDLILENLALRARRAGPPCHLAIDGQPSPYRCGTSLSIDRWHEATGQMERLCLLPRSRQLF